MYHKIGPRPPGVRLRGLYVSTKLLERQLSELHEDGYSTPPYGTFGNGTPAGKTLALTFDDGFVNAFQHSLEPLARHGFRAIQFLVVDNIGRSNDWDEQQGEVREPLMDHAQIRDWLAAGHEIGSHSLTHPFLTRISFREAQEEIVASKKKLEDAFGIPIRHFCYPYGDWNEGIRTVVQEAGYATACTTNFGVNTAATPPLELKRIMSRHRSISFKALKARLTTAAGA
jgi:peptidoglycan/xylan/chitin deacetylase (PgdA/CDA1 family)